MVSTKFYVDIDLNGNRLLKAAVEAVDTLPTTALTGTIVYYNVDERLLFFDGTEWRQLSTGADSPEASNTLPVMAGTAAAGTATAFARADHVHPTDTTRAAASDLDAHKQNFENPHSVTKAQVGLGSVDNTSDLAKPISEATQAALDNKVDKSSLSTTALASSVAQRTSTGTLEVATATQASEAVTLTQMESAIDAVDTDKLDKTFASTVVTGGRASADASSASIILENIDPSTGTTSSQTVALPVASDTMAGLATSAQIAQMNQNTADIASIKGKVLNYVIDSSDTSQSALTAAWMTASGLTGTPAANTTLLNLYNNHEYTWLTVGGVTEWVDRGTTTVTTATSTTLGIVKGSTTDASNAGKIYVEDDGTMSTVGWDELSTRVTNNGANITTIQSNITTINQTLDTKQDKIEGAVSEITNTNLPSDAVLVSDANGKVVTAPVTTTELGYMSGVTSGVQTQLDTKAAVERKEIVGDGVTTSFSIPHSLGVIPVVRVFDSNGVEVFTGVTATANTVTIEVNTPFANGTTYTVVMTG